MIDPVHEFLGLPVAWQGVAKASRLSGETRCEQQRDSSSDSINTKSSKMIRSISTRIAGTAAATPGQQM